MTPEQETELLAKINRLERLCALLASDSGLMANVIKSDNDVPAINNPDSEAAILDILDWIRNGK